MSVRLAVPLLERHRLEAGLAVHAFEAEGPVDALGLDDEAVLAEEHELVALVVAVDEAPLAARPEVHRAGGHACPAVPEPLADVLAARVGPKDEVAGRVEDAAS